MARRHSSPEDFQLLGMDSDPTPGNPEIIQDIVKRYRDIGDAAETALNVLKKGGAISKGSGEAMDKLNAKIGDDLPDKLTKTMTSYHDAAQAYTDYIPRLLEAQGRFDQAVDRARAAAPQASQIPKQLSTTPTAEEQAQARSTQDAIDAGQAELSAARSLAEQAKTLRENAQRRCAEVLDRAAEEAIPERNVFQKIADFFKDFPFVQILLSLLIAVVAVFFPVVGALLGGLLFVFNQVVASQTGGIKAGDFITGLLGIVPGGSLLKLGGRAVESLGSVFPAIEKASGLIKQASGSITKIGESLTNNKVVGGFLSHPVGKTATEVVGKFLGDSAQEAAAKAANGDKVTAEGVFAGAAAGAVAGAIFKGGVGAVGKGRGNPRGQFGDTAEPAVGDSLGKQASDQLGSIVEEGSTLGAKIGVGIHQGGDPKAVAAGEIANSASKLGVGAIGRAGVARGVDSLSSKIPFKGQPRPDAAVPAGASSSSPGSAPGPVAGPQTGVPTGSGSAPSVSHPGDAASSSSVRPDAGPVAGPQTGVPTGSGSAPSVSHPGSLPVSHPGDVASSSSPGSAPGPVAGPQTGVPTGSGSAPSVSHPGSLPVSHPGDAAPPIRPDAGSVNGPQTGSPTGPGAEPTGTRPGSSSDGAGG